jgi:hypothetical protein
VLDAANLHAQLKQMKEAHNQLKKERDELLQQLSLAGTAGANSEVHARLEGILKKMTDFQNEMIENSEVAEEEITRKLDQLESWLQETYEQKKVFPHTHTRHLLCLISACLRASGGRGAHSSRETRRHAEIGCTDGFVEEHKWRGWSGCKRLQLMLPPSLPLLCLLHPAAHDTSSAFENTHARTHSLKCGGCGRHPRGRVCRISA